MVSKIVLALCLMVAVTAAVPAAGGAGGWPGAGAGGWPAAGAVNPWIPPWVSSAPWFPAWRPCTAIGNTCADCTTKSVCTMVGQMNFACTHPLLPHCNNGECSATPSTKCAPASIVPAVPASV